MRLLPCLILSVITAFTTRTWLAPASPEAQHQVRLGRRRVTALVSAGAGLSSSAEAKDLLVEEPLIYCGGGFCAAFRLGAVLSAGSRLCGAPIFASGAHRCTNLPSSAHGVTAAGRLLTELSARPVLSATSAGVCAAVDRCLGRRLYFGPRRGQWRCRVEIGFFIQIVKFPIFEPLLVWILSTKLLTSSLYARAALAGLFFAMITLPFTNFRMGVSNRAMAKSPFKALVPTVARDMVYALGRAALPAIIVAKYSSKAHRLSAASPEVLFATVAGACLLAAPLNEFRDHQLSKDHASHFMPLRAAFFALIRSLLQAASLVLGYRYAPDALHIMDP
eukprot:g13941.t1